MAVQRGRLGELELEVLKVIWQMQPCTVLEVAEVMADRKGLARTTVLTVMQRLRAKGYLTRRKRRGRYRYWAKEERQTVMGRLVEQFVDKVLDRSALPLAAHLAQSKELTPEQAEVLRSIVREMDRTEKEAGDERSSGSRE